MVLDGEELVTYFAGKNKLYVPSVEDAIAVFDALREFGIPPDTTLHNDVYQGFNRWVYFYVSGKTLHGMLRGGYSGPKLSVADFVMHEMNREEFESLVLG